MFYFTSRQPAHLVEYSPWPMLSSLSALLLTSGSVLYWHYNEAKVLLAGVFSILMMSFFWWLDIKIESNEGHHTSLVSSMLRFSVMLFILSEVMFFFSFFWAFFHSCMAPTNETGYVWPPFNTISSVMDPFSIPLMKTALLLSSGATLTWSHHALCAEKFFVSKFSLMVTLLLGTTFLFLQGFEYANSSMSINKGIYGSSFFLLTGFHGLHVTIGVILLTVCFMRLFKLSLSKAQHIGYEASIWYWHFVDVVWIFLFLFVYWYCS